MLSILADLHVHTCLSPCADDLMTPKAIVEAAVNRGLALIAICDHNSAENVEAAIAAAASLPLSVLPGIEITTAEEVHILGIFDTIQSALAIQETVYEHLGPGQNDERFFGGQYVVDEHDYVVSENQRLLIGATDMPIDRVAASVRELGGLVVAAHIERERFGLLYQLGFMPESLQLDAVELTSKITLKEVGEKFNCSLDFPVVCDSDAHFKDDIGKFTTKFWVEAPTLDEIRKALEDVGGRRIISQATPNA